MHDFFKYHSLGNDFVIIDWFKKTESYLQSIIEHDGWKQWVVDVCARNTGVGADGVLVIHTNIQAGIPEVLIYNVDGSMGQTCLNGLRAVCHYLFVHRGFSSMMSIKMGQRVYECEVDLRGFVTMFVQPANVFDQVHIQLENEQFDGYVVSVGNPHYINFRTIDLEFLRLFGPKLESHPFFPERTNVEFIWQDCHRDDLYHMLVYERGCGITRACSSGAAAILWLLHHRKILSLNEKIKIRMLGGEVTGWICDQGMYLQAQSVEVFSGVLAHDPLVSLKRV